MSQPSFIPCRIKQLHASQQVKAAAAAIEHNPANRSPAERLLRVEPDLVLSPEHLALLTTKYWGPSGVKLGVAFLDTNDQTLQARILSHMNAWSQYANVHFASASAAAADVRIARTPGDGYWSYLGTDIRMIPRGEPTMNLDSFSLQTPESEYARVVRHETGHCLAGDTLIDCPRDLERYPLGIPIRDLVGQEPWVYAWKDGRVVVRKASRVWLSRRMAPTVRVLLKPGPGPKNRLYLPPLELAGTADHPVLLADGVTWKNLGDLQPGDRLCSLYRQANGDRSRLCWTGTRERVREHTLVCEEVHGARPEGYDAHHKNERKLDQSPENLEWKQEHAHHSDHARGRQDTDETRQRRSDSQKGRTYSEETRKKMSDSARNRPPISEETRARIATASSGRTQSPELLARKSAAMKAYYATGKRSGMHGKKASAETRAKQSAAMKAARALKREANNHTVVAVEDAGHQDVYDMMVPDAESFVANGVIVHNCLGFPHEHLRRQIVSLLDVNKTIAYFEESQGWSAEEVRQQVLTPLEDRLLQETPSADVTSIMCYQLPGSITTDGKPIPGGLDIDPTDGAFAAKVYPLAVQPPGPPPSAGSKTFSFAWDGKSRTFSGTVS